MEDERKERIKQANDIVDVVGAYVALRQAGQTYKGLCPFHDDKRPSFDVSPRLQRYKCWSCDKYGDVISFVQETERLSFLEALELLARRAGIPFESKGGAAGGGTRAAMLAVVRWAAEQFHACLLDAPEAEAARHYLGERKLLGETVRRFGVGFAPLAGDWLVRRAVHDQQPLDLMETVGLLFNRRDGGGYADRFRDRVMFPIRDVQGRPVGFGGRILPASPLAARSPKYYNSAETPLFSKSEHLYGIDQARAAGGKAGYLAVVEGYTDVLMAHQHGIGQVVSTMGTALNDRHVAQLRRVAPRVVLVFDADAGGDTGVDRALEIFVGQEVELAVATLPEGLDPCDLFVGHGADAFRQVLDGAVDVFDFKLERAWAAEAGKGVEGQRRAVDQVLGVLARVPERVGQATSVKRQLMVNRLARRLGLKEETVWARLDELRAARRPDKGRRPTNDGEADEEAPRQAPAAPEEKQLLQVLLADPALVPAAAAEVTPGQIGHPGLRRLLETLYALQAEGQPPALDGVRARLDNPRLGDYALQMQDFGLKMSDRAACLRDLLAVFRRKHQVEPRTQELHHRLHAASDHATALDLLRQLQEQTPR